MSRMLEELHPALSKIILEELFKKSICSCVSFLRTTPEVITKITGLSYEQIKEIKIGILTKFSSSLRFGHKYYHELIDHCAIVPSGIENFDRLLDYGFVTGNIYELCGFAGCGKTQICKTVTVNICKTNQQQVLYIDSKNDISAQRFVEIAESKKILNIDEILKKIQTCQVRTACDLLHQLHQLKSRLKGAKKRNVCFKLIIIDSFSSLFQQCQSYDGLSILNSISSLLKHITNEYHMIILLTNFVKRWQEEMETDGDNDENAKGDYFDDDDDDNDDDYDDDDDDDVAVSLEVQQPGLGRYWTSIPDVRIMIKKHESLNECILVVLKSINQPPGKSVKVKIADDGVM